MARKPSTAHLLPLALWEKVAPLLPAPPPPKNPSRPGRRRLDDRKVLLAVLLIMRTGMAFEDLPQELGLGSGMTAWRRLAWWNKAGVWQAMLEALLQDLDWAGAIDWSRSLLDSTHVHARGGGEGSGPSPVDRGKPGRKLHVVTDRLGTPQALPVVTRPGAHDGGQVGPLLDRVEETSGRLPDSVGGDGAYDTAPARAQAEERGVRPAFGKRSPGRWPVEQAVAHLRNHARLRDLRARCAHMAEAWSNLATVLVVFSTWIEFC